MVKKKIWIFNHYATNSFFNKSGRHYWLANYLIKKGYETTIFCANTRHNSTEAVEILNGKYKIDCINNIPFVFVKTTAYTSNGFQRIKNMALFCWNLFSVAKHYAKIYGKPNTILASSVHPLTLVAGIKIAKKFKASCICEVRDLWPESLVAYDLIKKGNILLSFLYAGEKWIYKKADKIIFTMKGGKDYIIERGWDRTSGCPIKIEKIYHVNNGVDLSTFDYNKNNFQIYDPDLHDINVFKIVYTGSIRRVNQVGLLLDVAEIFKQNKIYDVKFLIWGDGEELDELQNRVKEKALSNVSFKGRVDKKYIPYIITHSQLNIVLGKNNPLYRFGGSLNKMFDYFAAGKPILFTFQLGYSIIEKYKAGIELADSANIKIFESILFFKKLSDIEYNKFCINARKAAEEYDFKQLTEKLIDIIEE